MKNLKQQYVIRKIGTEMYCSDPDGPCDSRFCDAFLFDVEYQDVKDIEGILNPGEEAVAVHQPEPVLGARLAAVPEDET